MNTSPYNRRASDRYRTDSEVRKEILEQMSEIESVEYRVMLTMMLKIQDEMISEISFMQNMVQGYMGKISTELERISKTDLEIKKAVLDPHTEVHPEHHKWLENHCTTCTNIVGTHNEDGLCVYARQAKEASNVSKVRKWKVFDSIVEKIVLILLTIIAVQLFPSIQL